MRFVLSYVRYWLICFVILYAPLSLKDSWFANGDLHYFLRINQRTQLIAVAFAVVVAAFLVLEDVLAKRSEAKAAAKRAAGKDHPGA